MIPNCEKDALVQEGGVFRNPEITTKGLKAKGKKEKKPGWRKKKSQSCLWLASLEGEAFVAPLSSLHSALPLKIAQIKGERAHH